MKISVFTDSFRNDLGGGSKLAIDLSLGLKERGHEVLVISGQNAQNFKGVKLLKLPSIKYPLYKNAEAILPSLRLVRILKKFNPDIIHFHDPFTAGMLATLMGKYLDKKVIGTVHIDPSHLSQYSIRFDNGKLAKMLVGFISSQSDALIFVSNYQKRVYEKYLSKKCLKLVIYPGIPEYFFNGRKATFGRRILTVSRLAPEKNLLFTFKVVAEVQKKINAEYIVVGEGKEKKRLEKYAQKLGLKVKFLGSVGREKLPEIYSSSSVFLHTSKTETFGLVFAEAMACGLPVVALNYGSAPEVVGEGGIICEENVKETSEAVIELLTNEKMWKEKSENAKEISKNYRMEKSLEEHEKFYEVLKT